MAHTDSDNAKLPSAPNPDAGQKRIEELVGRARAVRDGTAELVDGEEALRRVRARVRELRRE